MALAGDLVGQPVQVSNGSCGYSRSFVVGDIQASREQFFAVLAAHELLGPDGLLRSDVSLLSIGDHFDYPGAPASEAAFEGLAVMRWLAEHPVDQVQILVGNHDLARVVELSDLSDDEFTSSQVLAQRIMAEGGQLLTGDFVRRYPRVPAPAIVVRDFSAFLEAQRMLLIELLLMGRMRLGVGVRVVGGQLALATHAGVTERELAILGLLASGGVFEIASALNRFLGKALDRVRSSWEAGLTRGRPLNLEPLHMGGRAKVEGGGFLCHRPADPDRLGVDFEWEWNPERPRRFDPRFLPLGLSQIVGHTTHKKSLQELARWVQPGSDCDASGELRTVTVRGSDVTYEVGLKLASDATQLFMIDGHMVEADPGQYRLLQVEW